MRTTDVLNFTVNTVRGNRARTLLMLFAMAIGVAAVVVLTALGEGARRYVTSEFAALGSHLLIVLPGRSETAGAGPAIFIAQTPRDLTIQDALSLRRISYVQRVAPLNIGSAQVSFLQRSREVPIIGTTAEWLTIRKWPTCDSVDPKACAECREWKRSRIPRAPRTQRTGCIRGEVPTSRARCP